MDNYKNGLHVAVVGNPNCGKTLLFNALTGMECKVANWPGVTSDKQDATVTFEDEQISLIDTPGIYSLSTYTIEEKITRNCILDDDIEVIVNVVDASNIERNLFLTLQLLELGKPVVVALNMMDVVEERGMEIDMHRFPEMLGDIPVVPVSAVKKKGLDILLHAVIHHKEAVTLGEVFAYSDEIESKISKIEVMMSAHYPNHSSARWHAIKLLENDEEVGEEHPIDITSITSKTYAREIIEAKYDYIDEIVDETIFNRKKRKAMTDRVDKILISPIWGIPCFLLIMALVFLLTFALGDFIKGYLEILLEFFEDFVRDFLVGIKCADWLISLIVDGCIVGVGGFLTFVPNIVILFFALSLLEDSGYIARVAYVMDGPMSKLGLSGRACLPMILGFGCTVPALMSTRSLERAKDRKTILFITPFMSCSARLPIYVLFSGAFFPKIAPLVSFGMYLLGLIVAIITAYFIKLFDKDKTRDMLLIELPEYKRPNFRSVRIYVWDKFKEYLTKALTIFVASIIIWVILNIGPSGKTSDPELSFAAYAGKFLSPILAPCGLNMWEAVVALISGISAKEFLVSSFTVLFGASGGDIVSAIQAVYPNFGPANALAIMAFSLLYTPCAASIGTIKKESGSLKFTIAAVMYELLVAWVVATLVYRLFLIIL